MRPHSDAPPQDPSTDGDQPTLQPVPGHAEPDRAEGQHHLRDAVDEPAADPTHPDGQPYADERRDVSADRRDEPGAGPEVAEPAGLDEPSNLKPGDAPAPAGTAIWNDDATRDLRDRWREAQLRFVDDPQKATEETRALVNEAVDTLTAALHSHREQLNSWPADGDTERYRTVVQHYRTFFERLLAV